MGHFPESAKLEFLPDGRRAKLLEDFVYVDNKGRKHKAPKGMITDGGSIPRRLWDNVGSPFTVALGAYVIHDLYCARALDLPAREYWKLRKAGDLLFAEMLESIGLPRDEILAAIKAMLDEEWPLDKKRRRRLFQGVRIGAFGSLFGKLFRRKKKDAE